MNLMKRLLRFLNSDDESPSEYHPEHIRQNKNIEARVTYQYPKGNFRFPLIPDNGSEPPRERRKHTKEVKQSTENKKNNQNHETSFKKRETRQQQRPIPVNKSENKQPFRPTETPSPVYGLTKPQLIEVVEYELPTLPTANSRKNIHIADQAQVEVAATISEELYEEVPAKEADFIYSEHAGIETTRLIGSDVTEQEEKEIPKQIRELLDEDQTINSPTTSNPVASFDDVVEQINVEEDFNDVVEQINAGEDFNDVVAQIDVVEDFNDITTEKQEHIETEQIQEKVEKSRDETRRRQTSIPFNVLMFKKDKQRLNQQKQVQPLRELENVQPRQESRTEQSQQEVVAGQNIKIERQHQGGSVQPQDEIRKESPQQGAKDEQLQHEVTKEQSEVSEFKPQPEKVDDNKRMVGVYSFPSLSFLNTPPVENVDDNHWLYEQKTTLDQTLRNFKVRAKVVNVTQGPAVTRFEVHPEAGVKVNKITNLSDDIKLSLAAKDIRIEAPIPGKNTIGIEVPNRKSKAVLLKEILQSQEFSTNRSPLTVALGLDISGKPIVTDLQKMPHGLIAGATGSGKSVCINTMLVSLLYKATPDQVKLLLIDPKMVELAPYNHIPHLVSPVITDVKAATAALKWAVEEMERRYELFAHTGVRDIGRYNEMVEKHDEKSGKLPYLVIIIDELADLMMVAPGEVEDSICRIAQKARACGIHLILATQRPSVDVITGLIKANIPTRIAFSVSSQVDSRTILDSSGADKLLGRGDMLFLENGSSKPIRVQGNFVSDDEIEHVVGFVKTQMKPTYMFEQEELLKKATISNEEDELFLEACEFVLEHGGASTSSVQRRFRIGYNRAARLIDMMEEQGIISESRGSKPREVLITEEELSNIYEN
ncbi:DNA translocase FtsK [Fredinandcohnia sp. 179-A 10B2 NHS]|uniref:DNA translocase FtsK n=1 Tax=Fredinandcohnia sp. 179-A 10B2 NHS TaxID=3235176 RepID=UPI0039A3233E